MYRILRNNKEQGPYKLDELIQLTLRPYDLVWIEGKSASWRYPSEIEELKTYVNGPPISTLPARTLSPTVLPVTPSAETLVPEKSLEQEEPELTAAMLEQKANAIYQRIQAYNAKCEQEGKDVQTKYARSLEDLKQDYADWLHGKKHKKREMYASNKGWVAFGAVSAAFIIFVLAGKDKEIVWPTHLQQNKTSTRIVETAEDNNQAKSLPSSNSGQSPENQIITIQYFIDSVRAALRKQGGVSKPALVTNKLPKRKVSDTQIANHPVEVILPPLEEKVVLPSIKAADLNARYIPSGNTTRIKEIHVTVQNTGTVALKQVTVDVFYYKKGDRLLDKETLFFNDIGPGNAYTVSKPANKKAVSARFELGELTADN